MRVSSNVTVPWNRLGVCQWVSPGQTAWLTGAGFVDPERDEIETDRVLLDVRGTAADTDQTAVDAELTRARAANNVWQQVRSAKSQTPSRLRWYHNDSPTAPG
jgi:hypothetical protein